MSNPYADKPHKASNEAFHDEFGHLLQKDDNDSNFLADSAFKDLATQHLSFSQTKHSEVTHRTESIVSVLPSTTILGSKRPYLSQFQTDSGRDEEAVDPSMLNSNSKSVSFGKTHSILDSISKNLNHLSPTVDRNEIIIQEDGASDDDSDHAIAAGGINFTSQPEQSNGLLEYTSKSNRLFYGSQSQSRDIVARTDDIFMSSNQLLSPILPSNKDCENASKNVLDDDGNNTPITSLVQKNPTPLSDSDNGIQEISANNTALVTPVTYKRQPYVSTPAENAHKAVKNASKSNLTNAHINVRTLIDSQRTILQTPMETLSISLLSESRKLREKNSRIELFTSGTDLKPFIAPYARIKPRLPVSNRLAETEQTKDRLTRAGNLISDFRLAFTKLGIEQLHDEITDLRKSKLNIFLLHTSEINSYLINALSMNTTFKTSRPITANIKDLSSYSLILFLRTINTIVFNLYFNINRATVLTAALDYVEPHLTAVELKSQSLLSKNDIYTVKLTVCDLNAIIPHLTWKLQYHDDQVANEKEIDARLAALKRNTEDNNVNEATLKALANATAKKSSFTATSSTVKSVIRTSPGNAPISDSQKEELFKEFCLRFKSKPHLIGKRPRADNTNIRTSLKEKAGKNALSAAPKPGTKKQKTTETEIASGDTAKQRRKDYWKKRMSTSNQKKSPKKHVQKKKR